MKICGISWLFEKVSVVLRNKTINMSFTKQANQIFNRAISDYHLTDDVNTPIHNPYAKNTIEHSLYLKCWIDTVQWHYEDIIRDPHIAPVEALSAYFRTLYSNVKPQPDARLNTESPAWAVDRLSILALKIYHMQEQVDRKDAEPAHIQKCQAKLAVLKEQQVDLALAIDQLLEDIQEGRKYMKVYLQMKMYNDPSTNPILYKK